MREIVKLTEGEERSVRPGFTAEAIIVIVVVVVDLNLAIKIKFSLLCPYLSWVTDSSLLK